MATDALSEYAGDDAALPIFDLQKVELNFDLSAEFVAAQVANNVLILALSTGRILRFDLDNASDIDDIDLPKRPGEVGVIRKLFLDPSASHLIVSTALGENYYLHTQSRQPKALSRLKGVQIECIAWNPSEPTASTREILIGAADGNVYETYIEPHTDFYRNQEKYFRNVYSPADGPVTGLYTDQLSARPDTRRVLIATQRKLFHFVGKPSGRANDGSGYSRLLDSETPTIHEVERYHGPVPACLAISPADPDARSPVADPRGTEKAYAWLCSQGIYHGNLSPPSQDFADLGRQVFRDSKAFPPSKLPPAQTAGGGPRTAQPVITSMTLTQFHVLTFVDGRIIAFNRLDDSIVYTQQVLESDRTSLGLFSDHQKNTYWLFTAQDVFEVVVSEEARDVWRIKLKQGQFDAAQRYAKTAEQKDIVAASTGDHLISLGKFEEAATILGRSTKAFEDVALTFIDKGEHDALRRYLLVKLSVMKKTSRMQRVMLASWLVELFMAKLNQLDDALSTKAELTSSSFDASSADPQRQLPQMRREFQSFVTKNEADLDRKTVYEIISAHGREEELLFFANVVADYNYVLAYWVQRERWDEVMRVLKRQTDPQMFYKYSTVLMTHAASELIDVLMRQDNLETKKIIPALLTYNKTIGETVPLNQNQAIRYLLFCINHTHTPEAAVHNTLISMYAANPTQDEGALLTYLETQSQAQEQHYDADFALRLCITHRRVQSAVHIYRTMHHYASAVDLALKNDEVELAANVADSPDIDAPLRKKLWLKIAQKVIGPPNTGIKAAMDFLKRCELLRIEDLIPLFPDFIVIDDFKAEICAALEDYSRQIDALQREMDESAATAHHIKRDVRALDQRYAIVEPGERCWRCRLPLLMRQFFVFPCQHAFHADCLGDLVLRAAGLARGQRIRELQREVGRGVALGKRREGMVRELDGLVAGACVLCSEMAVKMVDEPFVTDTDNLAEWAI